MKVVHLIMAHNHPGPELLARFVNRLRHPDDVIYIHIDLKHDITPFKSFFSAYNDVHFVRSRVKVYWATYSMIEATVNSFKEILEEQPDFGYLNLLSGQDYLLKPVAEFHQFLNQHPGKAFMNTLDVNTEWTEAVSRVKKYHLIAWKIPFKYSIQRLVNWALPERKMPGNRIAVGRSQWFTISKKHVQFIVDELKRDKELVRFFKLSWAPDEMLFQTILFNSGFHHDMVNDNLRYIDWSEGKKNPKTFIADDFEKLITSGKYFARKFDALQDDSLMNMIDAKLDARS